MIRVFRGFSAAVLVVFSCTVETFVAASAPIPVGVNFSHVQRPSCEYTFEWSILGSYDQPGIREVAQEQLAAMRASGMTALRLPIWHRPAGTYYLGGTAAGSTTSYLCPFVDGILTTERAMPFLRAGTVKNLYVRLATSQPASGNLVVTVRKNQVDTAITLTLTSASSAPATYSDTTHSFSIVAGDFISFGLVNNATTASGGIGFCACEIEAAIS